MASFSSASDGSNGSHKEGKFFPVPEEVTNQRDAKDFLERVKFDLLALWQAIRPLSATDENVRSSSKSEFPFKKPIMRAEGKPFLYIRDGDFDIMWVTIVFFVVLHILYPFGLYVAFSSWTTTALRTLIFAHLWGLWAGLGGSSVGSHRLWSHRSYKARLPLRIFLMFGSCIAGLDSILIWARDHRLHHKFSDSDGDPHNIKRGFFFAHIGWVMRKQHPQVILESQKLDFSDLMTDPVVRFQHKYIILLSPMFVAVLPTLIPWYFWGESLLNSFLVAYILRYVSVVHSIVFINSISHMFGYRPYDHKIEPRENSFVSYGALGEGYHNYHHSFPFDYRASEPGVFFNFGRHFIDLMAKLGLAYDLRTTSDDLVKARKEKVIELTNSNGKH